LTILAAATNDGPVNETLEFLVRHGTAVLFAAVFVEQMGVPLPAAPWLLAVGALAATADLAAAWIPYWHIEVGIVGFAP